MLNEAGVAKPFRCSANAPHSLPVACRGLPQQRLNALTANPDHFSGEVTVAQRPSWDLDELRSGHVIHLTNRLQPDRIIASATPHAQHSFQHPNPHFDNGASLNREIPPLITVPQANYSTARQTRRPRHARGRVGRLPLLHHLDPDDGMSFLRDPTSPLFLIPATPLTTRKKNSPSSTRTTPSKTSSPRACGRSASP